MDLESFSLALDEQLSIAKEKAIADGVSIDALIKPREKGDLLAILDMNGYALSENGALTRHKYFDKLSLDRQRYAHVKLTPEEAFRVSGTMRHLTTGVNSRVPLICPGNEKCPFSSQCVYAEMGKEPIGLPCLLERDLLQYHSVRFMEEFAVDPQDHSEVLLIQELSELIIYEMRLSMTLANYQNAELFTTRTFFDQDGNPQIEEKVHWAWDVKERIKNKRMKILEALNATRKQKTRGEELDKDQQSYGSWINGVTSKLDVIIKRSQAEEVRYEQEV